MAETVRALPAPVRHRVLDLVEAALRGEQVTWQIAGCDEEDLRALVVAAVGVAAVLARASASKGARSPGEVVEWLRRRV